MTGAPGEHQNGHRTTQSAVAQHTTQELTKLDAAPFLTKLRESMARLQLQLTAYNKSDAQTEHKKHEEADTEAKHLLRLIHAQHGDIGTTPHGEILSFMYQLDIFYRPEAKVAPFAADLKKKLVALTKELLRPQVKPLKPSLGHAPLEEIGWYADQTKDTQHAGSKQPKVEKTHITQRHHDSGSVE